MPEPVEVSVDGLMPELELLRLSGLAVFDVSTVPYLAALAAGAGFGNSTDMTIHGIQSFLRAALGLIDNDALTSSAAHLYGLAPESSMAASLRARTDSAAACRGVKYRAYSGDKTRDDVRMAAEYALSIYRDAAVRQKRQQQQRDGLPPTLHLELVAPPVGVVEYLEDKTSAQWLLARQQKCADLWRELLRERDAQIERLGKLSPKLCIFASGSYGREEAMEFSDLDIFLVHDAPGQDAARYGVLNKFELGHALTLVERSRSARGIQRFSQGGYYQEPQSFNPDHRGVRGSWVS